MGFRTLARVLGVVSIAVAAPVARADVEGRGMAVVRTGGGYATDIFLGAGYDPTPSATLAPSGVLDLSFSPKVKLFTQAELDAEHYFSTGGTAYVGYAEALLQLRPWTAVYPELFASAQGNVYQDLLGPPDPANPQLPSVSRAEKLAAGLALRGYWQTAELRVLALAALRSSVGAATYLEYPLNLQASGAVPLGARLRLGGYYRFSDNESDSPGFFFRAHEVSAFLLWRPGDAFSARVSASFRHNWNYLTGERDDFPRGTASLSLHLAGPLHAELAGTAEGERSQNPDGVTQMFTVYAGLRAEGGPWRF